MSRDNTERDYRQAVKAMAKEALQWADNEDELSDTVWESVDSSQYVMYTDMNLDALKYGEGEPDQMTRDLATTSGSWREILQAMAFDVVLDDVWNEVNRIRKKKEKDLEKMK